MNFLSLLPYALVFGGGAATAYNAYDNQTKPASLLGRPFSDEDSMLGGDVTSSAGQPIPKTENYNPMILGASAGLKTLGEIMKQRTVIPQAPAVSAGAKPMFTLPNFPSMVGSYRSLLGQLIRPKT